ncbi:hypothetical protein HDE_12171 [Halotydeus destructor]|nr:hypothetical protein HDE_12171 [Halotydeus destructor]
MSKAVFYQITLVALSCLHIVTYSLNLFDGIPDNNLFLFFLSCFLLLLFNCQVIYSSIAVDFALLRALRKCLIVTVFLLSSALIVLYMRQPFVFLNNKVIILIVCLFYFSLETLTVSLFIADCDNDECRLDIP